MKQKGNAIFHQYACRCRSTPMTKVIIDPSAARYPTTCYRLFFRIGIENYQQVDPDFFWPCAPAREGGCLAAPMR